MRLQTVALVALSVLCLYMIARPEPARAESLSLDFNPAQTRVGFTISALLHTVKGTFGLEQGAVTFDPATGYATGGFVINLASGRTGDAKRDARMKDNVLQVQTYPLAVFIPSRVQDKVVDSTRSELDVDGMLAIHGGNHPMMLRVLVDTKGTTMTATTQFSVPYVQWGMRDPSTFLLHVGKTVDVNVTAVGQFHVFSGNESPPP